MVQGNVSFWRLPISYILQRTDRLFARPWLSNRSLRGRACRPSRGLTRTAGKRVAADRDQARCAGVAELRAPAGACPRRSRCIRSPRSDLPVFESASLGPPTEATGRQRRYPEGVDPGELDNKGEPRFCRRCLPVISCGATKAETTTPSADRLRLVAPCLTFRPKPMAKWKSCFSPFLYQNRNAIERIFCRLKDFPPIATR